MLKLSLRMNCMITVYNYHRDRVADTEIRRSRNVYALATSRNLTVVGKRTKGALRMDIQYNMLTLGLPNRREAHGNGGLVVLASRKFYTGHTPKVTLREGKGGQLYDQFKKEHLDENPGILEGTKYRNIYKKV